MLLSTSSVMCHLHTSFNFSFHVSYATDRVALNKTDYKWDNFEMLMYVLFPCVHVPDSNSYLNFEQSVTHIQQHALNSTTDLILIIFSNLACWSQFSFTHNTNFLYRLLEQQRVYIYHAILSVFFLQEYRKEIQP